MTPKAVGDIMRKTIHMERFEGNRSDGIWYYWNEPALVGIGMRYGVRPETLGPNVVDETVGKSKPEQEKLV